MSTTTEVEPLTTDGGPRVPRDTFAWSPNVILLVDDDGTVVLAGGPCRELMDLDAQALEGRPLGDLVLPRDRTLLPPDAADLIGWESRNRHPLEVHFRHGRGPGDDAAGKEMAGGSGEQADRWRLFSLAARDLRDDPDVAAIVLALQTVGEPGAWDVSRNLLLEGIEAANSCIVIADAKQDDFPLVYANKGFRELTGYGHDEIIGRNCRFLQNRHGEDGGERDDDQDTLHQIRRALSSGEYVAGTLRNYTKSGGLFYNDLFLTPVYQDGELMAFIGVQNDVTSRVETEHKLRQRDEAITSFFDAAPFIMGLVELEGHGGDRTSPDVWKSARHVMLNRRGIDFLNVDDRGAEDKTLIELTVPERAARKFAENFAAAMRGEGVRRFECELKSAELGEMRRMRVLVNVVRPGDGEPPRCSYIAEDVTVAADAADRRRLLEAAVVSVDDAVLITDLELDEPGPRILFVNDAFTRLTGWPAGEVLGKTPRVLQGPMTDRSVLDRIRKTCAAGEPFRGETINYRKDGTPYHVAWTIDPVRDEAGNLTHWVSAQRDMTRRRKLERQVLEVQQREQERIARDLHDTVAQQLNTLSLYVGTVRRELEADGVASPEQVEQLREAGEQARRAAQQARALSHSLSPVTVDEGGLADGLRRLATSSQTAYGVQCRFDAPDPTLAPNVPREAGTHLYSIAAEAVSNAMRHAGAGHVTVRLRRDAANDDGEFAVLEVADDGRGFDPDAVEADDDAGIGLDSMRYRAEIVGGTLQIGPSDSGGGTVVTCRFPMSVAAG